MQLFLNFIHVLLRNKLSDPACNFTNVPISELGEKLPDHEVNDTCPMPIFSKAQAFVTKNNISAKKVQEHAKVFSDQLSLTNEERDAINKFTTGQREN
jgi:hypothetical protein